MGIEPELPKLSPELEQAIKGFEEAERDKSFSQRHPELGKMINCSCGRRHRQPRCEQRFAVVKIGDTGETRQTIEVLPKHRHGLGMNKRMRPHWNSKRLQLIQLTRDLISYFDGEDALQKARSRAMNLLRKKWNEPFAFKTKRFGKKVENNAVSKVVSEP